MKLLVDFFPIVCFFVTFKVYGIFPATIVAIVATVVQVIYVWFRSRRIEPMHLITLAVIVVFGGATLYFQNEVFIKWKPTVVNWLFGFVFLMSQLIGRRTAIERLLSGTFDLPRLVWQRLNLMWATFFIVVGFINLFVAYRFDTDTWVNFKLFGVIGLTVFFVILQSLYLQRHIVESDSK